MIYDFKASGNYFNLDFDIQLEKDQQVYCFIGENGVGKTKLLQTLAKAIIFQHSMFIHKDKDIKSSGIAYINAVNEALKNYPLELPRTISMNNQHIKNQEFGITYLNIEKLPNSKQSRDFIVHKPVVFISAKSRGYINGINDAGLIRLPSNGIQKFIDAFQHCYNSLQDNDIASDSVTNWLLQRLVINPNMVSGVERLHKEVIYVLTILDKLSPQLSLVSHQNNAPIRLNCVFHDGNLLLSGIPIQNLSTGYASILRIIQEIVAGLSAWDLENNIDLQNAEGIVFIDEIDLHLHPKWQFRIIDLLKEFFPKVTFYITTHSPLVLFNLKNGEGYKLHKDEKNLITAQKVEQSNMQFINDFISRYFISRLDKKHNDVDFNDSKDKLLELIGRLDIKDSDNDY